MNTLPIMYTDSIKYLCFAFTSNNCDDADILKKMRMLYSRSNRLVRLFNKCSKPGLHALCRSFALYSIVLISGQIVRNLHFPRYELRIGIVSIRRSWVCLDVLRLVLCSSLTTFLTLKLFCSKVYLFIYF